MSTSSNQSPVVIPEVVKRPVGRPAKITTLVPERAIADRVRTINNYHNLSRQAAEDAVSYAVMAGLELAAVKAEIAYGQFMLWVEKHCEFSQMTATRYMQLAERMVESHEMKAALLQLPGGQVQTAGDRKALMAAIRETADGETLRQLYFEFGILKPKDSKPLGGAREGAGRPTTSETEALRKQCADADCDDIEMRLSKYVLGKGWQYLAEVRRVRFCDALRGAIKLIERGA